MAEEQAVVSVADLLLRHGLVTREDLNKANTIRRNEDKTLGRVLYEMKVVNEQRKLALFKKHFGLEVVSLADFQIDPQDLGVLPRSFCERNCLVAVMRDHGSLVVAIEDPTNVVVLDEAANFSGMSVHPVIASCGEILGALEHYPEKRAEDDELSRAERSRSNKLQWIHDFCFAALAVLPIPIYFVLLATVKRVADFISGLEKYEMMLVSFLLWALWAVTIFEIDGLTFSRKRERH